MKNRIKVGIGIHFAVIYRRFDDFDSFVDDDLWWKVKYGFGGKSAAIAISGNLHIIFIVYFLEHW